MVHPVRQSRSRYLFCWPGVRIFFKGVGVGHFDPDSDSFLTDSDSFNIRSRKIVGSRKIVWNRSRKIFWKSRSGESEPRTRSQSRKIFWPRVGVRVGTPESESVSENFWPTLTDWHHNEIGMTTNNTTSRTTMVTYFLSSSLITILFTSQKVKSKVTFQVFWVLDQIKR